MKTKTRWVTKAEVIKAIESEPVLRRGLFFHEAGRPGCSVCAVGAIMRHASFERFIRRHRWDPNSAVSTMLCSSGGVGIHADADQELRRRNWLNALSIYFEQGHSREECIAFVKKHFPARIRISLSLPD